MKHFYIFGEGGLGKEVYADYSNNVNYKSKYLLKGFVVDHYNFKYPNTNHIDDIPKDSSIIIAIGDQIIRKKIHKKLIKMGFKDFPNYISSSVELNEFIQLGIGNILLKGTALSVDLKIGNFNVINKLCSIGHDVTISNFCTISPNVSISGNCKISDSCFLGISSTIIPSVSVNQNGIIGAGAVVIKNTLKNSTYVGVPAKKLK